MNYSFLVKFPFLFYRVAETQQSVKEKTTTPSISCLKIESSDENWQHKPRDILRFHMLSQI